MSKTPSGRSQDTNNTPRDTRAEIFQDKNETQETYKQYSKQAGVSIRLQLSGFNFRLRHDFLPRFNSLSYLVGILALFHRHFAHLFVFE